MSHFEDFWRELVSTGGELDERLIAAELFDYSTLVKSVAMVYPSITCGAVTSPMTVAEDVIRVSESCVSAIADEALELAMADVAWALQDEGAAPEQRVVAALAIARSFSGADQRTSH